MAFALICMATSCTDSSRGQLSHLSVSPELDSSGSCQVEEEQMVPMLGMRFHMEDLL
jgi:hypothetical protein